MNKANTQADLNEAWKRSYSPERNQQAIAAISDKPIDHRIMHFITRLIFRGIYFPQMGKRAWAKLVLDNRRLIYSLTRQGVAEWRGQRDAAPASAVPENLKPAKVTFPLL